MKKFRFNLETLLELRTRKEDTVKRELAEKNRLISEAQAQTNRIHVELKYLQSSEKSTRMHTDNIMTLRYSVAYRHKLKQDLLNNGRKIDDLKADVFKIQKLLVEATKERRAIEIIKERRLQEWKKEVRSEERNFVDDVSQQGYIRKHLGEKNAST